MHGLLHLWKEQRKAGVAKRGSWAVASGQKSSLSPQGLAWPPPLLLSMLAPRKPGWAFPFTKPPHPKVFEKGFIPKAGCKTNHIPLFPKPPTQWQGVSQASWSLPVSMVGSQGGRPALVSLR